MKNEIEFKFGDYATIEQKRHGVPNEMFVHKVVGQLRSNTWVDVPVRVPATETLHGEMEDICLCICCGIDETKVRRYRVKDMRRHSPVSLVADEKSGSTITLQAVNELIAALENAGELSIREQKFLKLAKAYQQLAAENVALKKSAPAPFSKLMMEALDTYHSKAEDVPELAMLSAYVKLRDGLKTPATDRIVAGFKADGVAEREKTITFTAAKKRTQDGVALIAIGKPYKIHNDDVIGEFFIGERGRYGVITMDRLNYFATSDEYAWAFSLREEAGK
ncbi:hypothetical protein MBP03_20290 [Klebsiella pneumoniae]|nr:hypothetical protein [Klebsiella pneumoniae]UOP93315.1 hypothetical protein MBP03_20290 [Klebsiella pneumoniae]